MENAVLYKTDGIERVEIDDGIVLKFGGQVHILNNSAALIFDLVDGKNTHDSIISEIRNINNGEDVGRFVIDFIRKLLEARLIHE